MKQFLSILFAILLGVGLLAGGARADGAQQDLPAETAHATEEPQSGEELFREYLRLMIRYADPMMEHALASRAMPDLDQMLNAAEYAYEQALKTEVQKIANGTRTDTAITVNFNTLGYSAGAVDMLTVYNALRRDCVYELYWASRGFGWSYPGGNSITLYIYVADAFSSGDTLTTDPTAVQTAQTAWDSLTAFLKNLF